MRNAAIAALIMSLAFAAARADVYRSVDAQGQVHYSDTPTPGAELVHVQRGGDTGTFTAPKPSSASDSAQQPAARNSPPTPAQAVARSNAAAQDDITRQNAQKAVQQDVDQIRADQCKKATADYDASVQARRIYRTGADGERQYLTDEEADQQRLNLRMAMQSACGTG
ncbi:MAG TPA: DUF4124 domain-containing protein [Steroidobacteraceae bacterium]|jgi:hypothetical protein|nr:DUF4124 domain-containing protein [Steroidobacteraceae bacterium]